MLLVFRYTSDQEGIKKTKERIKGHLMEIRLFKDELMVFFSALKNILLYNLKYMNYMFFPFLIMILPIILLLIHLNGWFGPRPLKPGESAIVSVKVSNQEPNFLNQIQIKTDEGITVETPSLRIPETSKIEWRIRANRVGEHLILLKTPDQTFQKTVIVSSDGMERVSPRTVASNTWEVLLNPGERPFNPNAGVRQIDILYPAWVYPFLGWEIDWIIVFFILSIVFGFVLKGVLRVQV